MNDQTKRAAVIQMVSGGDWPDNRKAAEALLAEAAGQGADLAVLPENFALMGRREQDKLALAEQPGEGPIQAALADWAGRFGMWIVGGSIPLAGRDPGRVLAACPLYDRDGRQVACYHKIHLFDVDLEGGESYRESATLEPGDTPLVVDTELGRLGLAVCYDLRFPELFRAMQRDGMQLLALPSAFTATTGRAHWEPLLRARAIENQCYVLATNQGGRHDNGRETYGHSMIVDPWGRVLADAGEGPGVVCADIDLTYLQQVRSQLPALHHRRF